jgi:acyl-CoA thioesterase-1
MTLFSTSIRFVLLSILLASLPALSAEKQPPVILVIGDSLSGAYGINIDEGWVALLQQQLDATGHHYLVINASVSGDTSRTGLGRIASALQTHKPAIVIIALGGNDGLRGLAHSETGASLAGIIERSQQQHARVLLVGVRLPSNYGPTYNEQFAAVYRGLSDQYAVPLVPRMLEQVAEHRELLQDDGIHPTAAGQTRIMHNIWAGLEPMLQDTSGLGPGKQHSSPGL